jgi:hypothetical protein
MKTPCRLPSVLREVIILVSYAQLDLHLAKHSIEELGPPVRSVNKSIDIGVASFGSSGIDMQL